jgi:hypothetical protein
MHFSSHSGRVWAIVILDEAGMLPDFIKSRLCWMGDSYRLYLRDTSILQQKHLKALERASTEFTALFGENRMTLPDFVPWIIPWILINTIFLFFSFFCRT